MYKRKRYSHGRVKGYHYAYRSDGSKYRVYTGHGKGSLIRSIKRQKLGLSRYKPDVQMQTVSGYGAYFHKKAPLLLGPTSPPKIVNSRGGGFIVRHREFIGDLNASVAFQAFAFSINPGVPATFPWLASVARNFEEWVPRGILFEYKTTSSDSVVSTNANAGLGTVVLATEYNPYNGTFASKQQMENYENAVATKPSCDVIHQVETKKSQNPMSSYYVRTGDVPNTQDIRLYDLGTFQIAAVGMQSNGNPVGELWVTYEIELRKPRIQVGLDPQEVGGNFDHFSLAINDPTVDSNHLFGTGTAGLIFPSTNSTFGGCVSGGIVLKGNCASSPDTPTKNNFLGGVAALDVNGNPTGVLEDSNAQTYYFPPQVSSGNYMLVYRANCINAGQVQAYTSTRTNCTILQILGSNGNNSDQNTTTGTNSTTKLMFIAFVKVTKANANILMTLSFGSGSAVSSAQNWDLYVTEIPDPMN